jgi:proteasome assembly chaperone (PAC2) family protein
MLKNGRTRLISNRFYYAVNKNQTILLLLGDTQAGTPEGQHEVSEKIVRFFKALGGKKIYTIGGYNSGSHYLSNPRVFAVATDQKTKSELSLNKIIFGTANGAIWGAAGLIISYAKKYKINAACIMGETSALDIDANAAKAVLNSLKDLLDIKINLDNINKIKEETDRLIKEMEQAAKDQEMQHSKDTFTYIR